MPPFEGRRFEPTPKSPQEEQEEREIKDRYALAYSLASGIPVYRKKRSTRSESVKAVYKTADQADTNQYTRAWIERTDNAQIYVYTDTVTRDQYRPERDLPGESFDEFPKARLMPPGGLANDAVDLGYRGLNNKQTLELLDTTDDTLSHISRAATYHAIQQA